MRNTAVCTRARVRTHTHTHTHRERERERGTRARIRIRRVWLHTNKCTYKTVLTRGTVCK